MSESFQGEINAINRDILELKTAKTIPSLFTMYSATATVKAGKYTDDFYYWRIVYEDVGDYTPPIITMHWGAWYSPQQYNPSTNTQPIECFTFGNQIVDTDETFLVNSSRPIVRIEQVKDPGPLPEWKQILTFNPADMGTTPGWCLQNCRLGFGIPYGTYASARADWNAQIANGTLHQEIYPPADIQVPIYIDTGTADGHVGVWDRGTFYSDGYIINDFVSYYGEANIIGWGELCDGGRVVQHV